MEVSTKVRETFRECYGFTLEEASNHLGELSRVLILRTRANKPPKEGRGRSDVSFGGGIDATQKDDENRQILSNW